MRLKIETNGKPEESRIYDVETGRTIKGVKQIEIIVSPFEVYALVMLTDFDSDLEFDKDAVRVSNNSEGEDEV